jgi:hypothetical protein
VVGAGTFATRPLRKGTILWVLDELDRVMTPDEVDGLPELLRPVMDRYSYVDRHGRHILCWDHGRYMNHACDAVTIGVADAFEIAVRDVAEGEQVTCDYGILNMLDAFDCRCGAASCRGRISAHDAERFVDEWDARAQSAFDAACGMEQILLPFARLAPIDQPLAAALRAGQSIAVPSARGYLRQPATKAPRPRTPSSSP